MFNDNTYYRRGKQLRLDNEPCPPRPPRTKYDQRDCDIISGWRVADNNIRNHPDWTREQILA